MSSYHWTSQGQIKSVGYKSSVLSIPMISPSPFQTPTKYVNDIKENEIDYNHSNHSNHSHTPSPSTHSTVTPIYYDHEFHEFDLNLDEINKQIDEEIEQYDDLDPQLIDQLPLHFEYEHFDEKYVDLLIFFRPNEVETNDLIPNQSYHTSPSISPPVFATFNFYLHISFFVC